MPVMNTNKEDEMLKKFFSENRTEIADNGFSKKVMQKIPQEQNREWIVWVFAIVGMALTSYLAFTTGLTNYVLDTLADISVYNLLIVVFCFPLVTFLVLFLQKNKYLGLGQF